MIFRRIILSLAILFMILILPVDSLLYADQTTLIQADVFKGIPKLTRGVANSEWNVDLFSKPYSSTLSYTTNYDPPHQGMRHALVFVTDPCWNRIVYYDYVCNWIKAWGNSDHPDAFNFPHGITSDGYSWTPSRFNLYIADTGNDRIVHLALVFEWGECGDPTITYQTFTDLVEGLNEPYDVDLNEGVDIWDNSDDYLWVADYGNQKIKRFNLIDNDHNGIPDEMPLIASYGGYGSGVGQFKYPRAIINGRNWETGKNNKYLYVADAGNNRIVRLYNPVPTTIQWVDTYEAPQGSHLISLATDTYGNLWVADFTNGKILKLTPDLELITTIGSMGTGGDRFLYPTGFSTPRAFQYQEDWWPGWIRGFADASISEKWTDNSGGRRYLMGVDVLNLDISTNDNHTNAICSFTLTDPANLSVKVYDHPGNLMATLCDNEERNVGDQSFYWSAGDKFYAKYTFKITAKSLYQEGGTGDPLNTVVKEANVWTGGNVVINLQGYLTPRGIKVQLAYTPFLSWEYTGPESHSVYYYYLHGVDPHQSGEDYNEWQKCLYHQTFYTNFATFYCEEYAWYYVKAYLDEFGGPKVRSNLRVLTAPPCPYGCPFVFTWDGREYLEDNNILPASELSPGEGNIIDKYKLEHQPVVRDKEYLLQIREFEHEHSYLDQVKLLAVDHPGDVLIGLNPEGEIIPYRRMVLPTSCVDNSGRDHLKLINGVDDQCFQGHRGDWLVLDFGVIGKREANLETISSEKAEATIALQVQRGKGWEDVALLHPRENWSAQLIDLSPFVAAGRERFKLRLLWKSDHKLDYIGLAQPQPSDLKVQECPLKSAVHSRIGPVTKHLLSVDEKYSELIPGEQIDLAFSPLKPTEGYQRDFILVSTGYYVKGKGYTTLPKDITDHLIPTSFSLSQNYPNPFNLKTEIGYALPKDSYVTLKIYNVRGQLVRDLVDEEKRVGYHKAFWDGKNDKGEEIASGLYFYWIKTGEFVKTRKMILLR